MNWSYGVLYHYRVWPSVLSPVPRDFRVTTRSTELDSSNQSIGTEKVLSRFCSRTIELAARHVRSVRPKKLTKIWPNLRSLLGNFLELVKNKKR